jgi:hypothetical protein
MANIENIAKRRKYYGTSNLRGFNIKKSDETDDRCDFDVAVTFVNVCLGDARQTSFNSNFDLNFNLVLNFKP